MIAETSLIETQQLEQTDRNDRKTIAMTNGDETDENIYLIGRPTLGKFLRFMTHQAADGALRDEGALTDEWRAAHEHIRTLEKDEAGVADYPPIGKLDARLEPVRDELLKDPLIVHGFNTVPTNIVMVELDRMVVYQKHIDLAHVSRLKNKLGPAPSDEEIFRTCLPADHPQPPMKWSRVHQDTYVFMSPSNDLRFLRVMPLQAKHITNYPPPGTLAGVVGIAVGFGSNFLNAIYADNRLVLNNGSHRAYALRDLGFTHAPCIVQYVSSREELDVVASGDLRDHPDLYVRHPRPPMLKDYFNPKLRKIAPVRRRSRQVTVKFEVDEAFVPAL
jgi:hypothetical protein